MAQATINHAALNSAVQNAINGLVARIIDEEAKAAQTRVQMRVVAETRGLVAQVMSDHSQYKATPEVNVAIHFPDAKA